MEIHYKCTIWVKIDHIDEKDQNQIIKSLNSGKSILEAADELRIYDLDRYEYLTETEEALTPEENGGDATIYLYEDNGYTPIWNNKQDGIQTN